MPANPAPPNSERTPALDLIRGVAVLGILAVNIGGFAGPQASVYTPHAVFPPSPAGDWTFAAMLLVFEGKMRALFSMLFGVSMMLLIERAERAGRSGTAIQFRRLLWLALFGYLHHILLWWGDILLLYAMAGLIVLALRTMPLRAMLATALAIFVLWQAMQILNWLPLVAAEHAVAAGTADRETLIRHAEASGRWEARAVEDVHLARSSFAERAAQLLAEDPLEPVTGVFGSLGETIPYMLIGMALYASGLFAGRWSRDRLLVFAAASLATGATLTAAFAVWAFGATYPPYAMVMMVNYGLSIPHLLMALGYGALLILAAPRLLRSRLGERLAAAGRMAFSNYIGATILMTGIFNGWGLGLVGRVPVEAQPLFVVLGWALMLAWSKPWLGRFRQGPLEWLWRSLVEGRRLPFRR